MTRWEYLSVDLGNTPTKEDDTYLLNMAGARGWELVVVTAPQRAIFKRPRPQPQKTSIAVAGPTAKQGKGRTEDNGR